MLSEHERNLLQSAQAGNEQPFSQLVEPYRRELQLHSYRLLGSALDAEDVIQETFLRAWKKLDAFTVHGSFRAWLYKIATNLSLNALHKNNRTLKLEAESSPTPAWLEPIPDEWRLVGEADHSPENQLIAKEDVHLAFITLLQTLPPRQRAVFVFRDVLGWRAKEVAEALDLTLSSVNSLLHRARASIESEQRIPSLGALAEPEPPLLERYVRAWEDANIDDLVALLVDEAAYTMPPMDVWLFGRNTVRAFLGPEVFAPAAQRPFRCRQIRANGQTALAVYQQNETGDAFDALLIQALSFNSAGDRVQGVIAFLNPALFRVFGLPAQIHP